jgi:hypothetical protein
MAIGLLERGFVTRRLGDVRSGIVETESETGKSV